MTFDERIDRIEEYIPEGYTSGVCFGRALSDRGLQWYMSFGLMHRPKDCTFYCDTLDDCMTQVENWLSHNRKRK
jgi:hypothetical protein